MSRTERFVALWNEGRVREALGETAEDYSYWDSVMGGPHDRDAHVAMMESIFEAMPDRRISIIRQWATDDAEFCEYIWRGTGRDGSVIESYYFGVFEFDTAGRAVRQRHFAA